MLQTISARCPGYSVVHPRKSGYDLQFVIYLMWHI
uniref:Uncharacterized protein n=1 Tax=Arundo donax TaxID=35708 RepID=A0A0A9EJR8_ARUDO